MEPASKRMRSHSPDNVQLPFSGEVMNQIYQDVMKRQSADRVVYTYQSLNANGTKTDVVKYLHPDSIAKSGQTNSYKTSIVEVAQLSEDFQTLTLPMVLFSANTPGALHRFNEAFDARNTGNRRLPNFNIEIALTKCLKDDSSFSSWTRCEEEHGKELHAYDQFEEWFKEITNLSDTATIILVFDCFWRDYRSLWGLCSRYGLHERQIGCRFTNDCKKFPQHNFHIDQTLSAVTNVLLRDFPELNYTKRRHLVDHGCRGFNNRLRPTPAPV